MALANPLVATLGSECLTKGHTPVYAGPSHRAGYETVRCTKCCEVYERAIDGDRIASLEAKIADLQKQIHALDKSSPGRRHKREE